MSNDIALREDRRRAQDLTSGYHSLVAATLVQEVKVLDEEAEERHYDPLAFVRSASATPHCCLQRAAIAAEVAARVHLMLQNRELGGLHLRPLRMPRREKKSSSYRRFAI